VNKSYHPHEHLALTRASTVKTALEYARKGIPVFPLKGKEPLTPHGFKDASHDTSRVTAMFNAAPNATGCGIPTGGFSGLVVVDKDSDSPEARRIWDSLPPTVEVATSRGRHRYYRIPNGTKVRSRKLASDLDLKADGGYVVAARSVHESGIRYEFVEETVTLGVAALPDNLLEPERRDEVSRRREGTSIPVDDGGPIPEGTRNRTLTSIGGRLRAQGLAQGDLEDHLLTVNAQRCTPPLGEEEVGRIAASVARYAAGDASSGPCAKVRAKLTLLEDAAGERPVVGMRGGSGWSIYNAALEGARQHGVDHPDGIELSLDVRTWAQMAGTHAATVSRFVHRSPLVRQLRRGSGQRAGSVVLLLPREIGGKLQHSTTEVGSREPSVADRPLFRTLYRLRWGPGRIGKSRAALLTKVVECPGVSRSELAHRLGRKPASLKKPLKWLIDAGLLVRTGWGRYDLTDGFAQRLDDLRVVGGEPEADRLQILKHNHQRDGYRNRGKTKPTPHKANLKADGHIPELERVPAPDPDLVNSLRAFLRRHPHRRQETPNWLGVALWAEDYVSNKPLPLAVELALSELHQAAA
jgi:hypothetical protein